MRDETHILRTHDLDHVANHVTDLLEQRKTLRDDTDALVDLAKSIEGGLNGLSGIKAMMTGSAEAKTAKARFGERMREHITDDDIFKILIPEYPFGCRRLTPSVLLRY